MDNSVWATPAALAILAQQYVDLGTGRYHHLNWESVDSGAEGFTGFPCMRCAIMTTVALACWGANSDGQLGIGNTTTNGDHTDNS